MTKEEVDADLKAFLDILAIACEVLQVAGHQTLDEVVDLDLARHKSRGEAIDNAMKAK